MEKKKSERTLDGHLSNGKIHRCWDGYKTKWKEKQVLQLTASRVFKPLIYVLLLYD